MSGGTIPGRCAPDRNSANVFKSAVGLAYSPDGGQSPHVAIKGSLMGADEIVRLARRFGVPIVEQRGLCTALARLELDAHIPPSLFEAVAIILARLQRKGS